jgi:hypothetical protein
LPRESAEKIRGHAGLPSRKVPKRLEAAVPDASVAERYTQVPVPDIYPRPADLCDLAGIGIEEAVTPSRKRAT